MKNARRKLETSKAAAMPCKRAFPRACIRETVVSKKEKAKASAAKTRFSCITEAHESTRQRTESPTKRIHEEHIAGKGQNSVLHYNLVHRFMSMLQAMKIPDAKAAVVKEWKQLETIPAWDVKKVSSKKEIEKEAQKNNNKVHFASLMDLCHLKISELEPQFQKYKGRFVSRRHCERPLSSQSSTHSTGSSASQPTAAKAMDLFLLLERNLYGDPLAGVLWERQFERNLDGTWLGKSTKLWMLIRSQKTKFILIGLRGEEIPPPYGYCTQYQKHYANDAEELERYGLFKKSKTHVSKLNALNP